MNTELSEFAKIVLFKISHSKRGTDQTGKFMTIEELEYAFGDPAKAEVDAALVELIAVKYIRELEESDDAYFLTPFGEAYLSQPQTRSSNEQRSAKTETELNAMEQEILQYFYEKSRGPRGRKETPTGLMQDLTRSHKDWNRSDIEEAIDILTYQKYLKEKTETSKHHPKVFNKYSKERVQTFKTTYVELTGKALLYLKNRDGKNASAAVYDKTTPYSTRRQLESLFEGATKQILIADNYIGRKTLDYLLAAKVPVRILTSTQKEANFDAALADFQTEYAGTLDIKSADGVLHGRFIIVDDKYYVVDHSIKDFGSKPSAIIEITDAIVQATYKKLFEDNWI